MDGVELVPAEARLATILRERPGVPISRDELIARLWPDISDYPKAHAQQHLRELVYRVRAAFRHETGETPIATLLGEGYVWRQSNVG